MPIPTLDEAAIYKAPTITSQVRVAVELDRPVFSGLFDDHFAAGALDTDLWFSDCPSWGNVVVAGTAVTLSVTGWAIRPPWLQTRHNLAFPLRHDTDWVFSTRFRWPVLTGYGVFFRLCGHMRSEDLIASGYANELGGGFDLMGEALVVSTPVGTGPTPWYRWRVTFDASAQTYTAEVDTDDDGVYEVSLTKDALGCYAEAIVIGNSTAIQGAMGAWSEIEVDRVTVTGTAETIEDPDWAAPFTYDGTRMTYLPVMLGGRIDCDVDNQVDVGEITLDNFWLSRDLEPRLRLYTDFRFWNRRLLVEARAGDGNGRWTNWQVLMDGLAAEKRVSLQGGVCTIVVPFRDRWRAKADDSQVLAAYSDAATTIAGVGMHFTVQQIVQDLLTTRAGLLAAAMNVVATALYVPRNYNVFRMSVLAAVKQLCQEAALAVYQRRSDARIEVQEWAWGTDAPAYWLSTGDEVDSVEWTESAFDATAQEQLAIENTNMAGGGFTNVWPPHRQPFYGVVEHANSVASQSDSGLTKKHWWQRNRKLGSVTVGMKAQLWLEYFLEVGVADDRFIGFGRDQSWIVDGWSHAWDEAGQITSTARLINTHPERFLAENMMP
ncbi:MAG: hypothetical protein WC718_15500 [Phycisphaerales bacterium]|jgi:hypothetical protein